MLRWLLTPFVLLVVLIAGDVELRSHVRLVQHVSESIVRISGGFDIDLEEAPYGYICTGEVVAKHLVLTAAHCLFWDTQADTLPVQVLRVNAFADLALVQTMVEKPALHFREQPLVRNEPLTAIGYAYGARTLSAFDERALVLNYTPEPVVPVVGPVLAFAPGVFVQGGYIGGMSGGPVVDREGQVVSIVQRTGEGGGYGVTAETIRTFLSGVL